MKHQFWQIVLIFSLVSLLTTTCSNPTSTPFNSPLPPIETVMQTSPLPSVQSKFTPLTIPTSSPGHGTVQGTLVTATDANIVVGELFLAEAIQTSNPDIRMPALDTEHSPRAYFQRETGRFVFVDVPPGEYGLIVWEPFNSILVNDPNTGRTLFVSVEPDQIIKLEDLEIP